MGYLYSLSSVYRGITPSHPPFDLFSFYVCVCWAIAATNRQNSYARTVSNENGNGHTLLLDQFFLFVLEEINCSSLFFLYNNQSNN